MCRWAGPSISALRSVRGSGAVANSVKRLAYILYLCFEIQASRRRVVGLLCLAFLSERRNKIGLFEPVRLLWLGSLPP